LPASILLEEAMRAEIDWIDGVPAGRFRRCEKYGERNVVKVGSYAGCAGADLDEEVVSRYRMG
jgi:hypothetical protein